MQTADRPRVSVTAWLLPRNPERLAELILCSLLVILMGMQAIALRQSMNPDGISYLDIADRFLVGDFTVVAHPYWSPLYPALLAIAMKITAPSSIDVFLVVHAVNWVIGLTALCSFAFLLHEVRAMDAEPPQHPGHFSSHGLHALSYALFAVAVLDLTGIGLVTPDLLVCSIALSCAGLFLRIDRLGDESVKGGSVLLGGLLGLAYYAKAALLPVGCLLIACMLLGAIWKPKRLRIGIVAGVIFLVTVFPLVLAVSSNVGHFSIGETGRLNYAHFVLHDAQFFTWHDKTLAEDPLVVDFRNTVSGTLPPHFDPTYFAPHMPLRLDPALQLAALLGSFGELIAIPATVLLVSILVLVLLASPQVRRNSGLGLILAWSIAAICLYGLVLIEPRYVAPFWLLAWLIAFRLIRPGKDPVAIGKLLLIGATLVFVKVLWTLGLQFSTEDPGKGMDAFRVAGQLQHAGIGKKARLAVVGFPYGRPSFVAKLGDMSIVANVPNRNLLEAAGRQGDTSPVRRFWMLDEIQLQFLFKTFKDAGIDAILALDQPCPDKNLEWISLGSPTDCVRKL